MSESTVPAASKDVEKPGKRRLVPKAALCLAGMILIVVFWAWIPKGSTADNRSEVKSGAAEQNVPVAKATRENLKEDISLYAEFRPYQEIMVHAKVSGYVRSILVDIGDHVQAGESLAILEIPELREDLNRASAALAKSQEEVKHAEAEYRDAHLANNRLLEVARFHPSLVAQQELDVSQDKDAAMAGTLGSARQKVQECQADLDRMHTMLDYATITAPFSGIITNRFADTGALIQAGTASNTQAMPLVELAEDNRLRLDFPVPESAVPKIHVGAPVVVSVDALHETFPEKISRYSGRVDVATRKMQAEVEVPNYDLKLTPGMYATVRLVLQQSRNALTVPLEAVALGQNPTVVVLNREHQLEKRNVTVGLQTANKIEIRSGLVDNELVLVGNRTGIQFGQKAAGKLVDIQAMD